MSIECSTCMEPLMANGDNSTTLCGHVFHTDCIKEWFKKGQSNCPHCRNATTINQLIKTHFSEAEEEINRDAAGDALEADLKCIELAEKNENLQKEMKDMTTRFQKLYDLRKEWNEKLLEENKTNKMEKLELEKMCANLIKENENNKRSFQKLNKQEQKVYLEKLKLQRRLDFLKLVEEYEMIKHEKLELEEKHAKLGDENEMIKNEKLEVEKKCASLMEENESNKKCFHKLNEQEQKVYIEKRRLDFLDWKKEIKMTETLNKASPEMTVPHIKDIENLFAKLYVEEEGNKNYIKYVAILHKILKDSDLIHEWRGNNGETVLHLAAKTDKKQICKMILDQYVDQDKNPKSATGWTPLHYAAFYRHVEIYQMIIEVAKDKNPKDIHGQTPLKLAAGYGEIERVYQQYKPKSTVEASKKSCCIM